MKVHRRLGRRIVLRHLSYGGFIKVSLKGSRKFKATNTKGKPNPPLAQLAVLSFCFNVSTTGDTWFCLGNIHSRQAGQEYPAGAV